MAQEHFSLIINAFVFNNFAFIFIQIEVLRDFFLYFCLTSALYIAYCIDYLIIFVFRVHVFVNRLVLE